jgi:hypothetical protein
VAAWLAVNKRTRDGAAGVGLRKGMSTRGFEVLAGVVLVPAVPTVDWGPQSGLEGKQRSLNGE